MDEYFHVYVENLHPTEALPATISRNLYGLHSPPMGGQNVYFYSLEKVEFVHHPFQFGTTNLMNRDWNIDIVELNHVTNSWSVRGPLVTGTPVDGTVVHLKSRLTGLYFGPSNPNKTTWVKIHDRECVGGANFTCTY